MARVKTSKAPDMESEGLDRTELESIKRVPFHGRPSQLAAALTHALPDEDRRVSSVYCLLSSV